MTHSPALTELVENLVPFDTYPASTTLIWSTSEVGNEEVLRCACSYLSDSTGFGTAKVFLAERYGGSGIQRNGGGARCGFDGCYQVKGIGANPLVGLGTDWHHSNGALAADHAIYEAIWGEVLAQLLPYGAVRAQAVLLTDKYIDINFERNNRRARRALLVREPVIRPAHFERAPYFRPQPEYVGKMIHDAQRVRSVIRLLSDYLPTPTDGFSEGAYQDPQRHCVEGLCELARRQARQMAFCRTRFLMLTTSPSNVAMDGRLLDFTGLNCLFPCDHRYDFDYRLKLAQMMREPAILQQGLSDLCLYIGKYLFGSAFTSFAQQQVGACFQHAFQEACYRGYLALLGIPVDILPSKEIPNALKQLVNSFMKLFGSRRGMLYYHQYDVRTETPLEQLVVMLIRCSQGQSVSGYINLDSDICFVETLSAFVEANLWLSETCHTLGIDASVILKGMERQARQRLQPRERLGKIRMLEEIAGLLEANSGDDLRHALSVMEARTLAFAKEAFGCEPVTNHVPEGYVEA